MDPVRAAAILINELEDREIFKVGNAETAILSGLEFLRRNNIPMPDTSRSVLLETLHASKLICSDGTPKRSRIYRALRKLEF